jgi:hypothetical protein
MSYVTLEEFKAAVEIGDTHDDLDIQRALDAATAWIDHYTGRTFSAVDVAATAKYFLPYEQDTLTVPDLTSVSELAIDTTGDESFGVTLAPEDYDLLPLNLNPDLGGYTEIRLKPTAPYWFVVGYQVRVMAFWGYGATPAAVQQACILVANRYFARLSVPFSLWEAPQTGELATLLDRDPDVINLLGPYITSSGAGRGASLKWVLV